MLDTQRDLVSLLNLGPPVTFLVNVVDLMYQTTTGQPLEKSSLLIPSCNVIRRQAWGKVLVMSLTKLPEGV